MTLQFIHIAAILLFIFKVASGIWLRQSDRPVHTALLNLHKFIALGTIAVIILIVRQSYSEAGANALITGAIVLMAFFFLVAVVTGGLVSLEKPPIPLVKLLHKAMPLLTALFTLLAIYLIQISRQ
jgi:hypothetical protein